VRGRAGTAGARRTRIRCARAAPHLRRRSHGEPRSARPVPDTGSTVAGPARPLPPAPWPRRPQTQAYRRLALVKHPDKAKTPNAAAEFAELQRAYAVLSDAGTRAALDDYVRRGGERARAAAAGLLSGRVVCRGARLGTRGAQGAAPPGASRATCVRPCHLPRALAPTQNPAAPRSRTRRGWPSRTASGAACARTSRRASARWCASGRRRRRPRRGSRCARAGAGGRARARGRSPRAAPC
jgi:curved DNA-binding protein CbpA